MLGGTIFTISLVLAASQVAYSSLSVDLVESATRPSTRVAGAWYASWHANVGFPLSEVPWKSYTHLTYAFAETTPDAGKLDVLDPILLSQFVSEAHRHGVKALVSIGGWKGSRGFSLHVGSAKNRTKFVKTVTQLAHKYSLDGIDFDWEYPARQGIGCNAISSSDTHHFLLFLQELRRSTIGSKLLLSAAVATVPFFSANGSPLNDVSGFAKVLDWIAIMNYDLWGPWTATVGPNAPLDDTCAASTHREGSAMTSVKKWNQAGIPHSKMVLGVAGYGHSFRVRRSNAFAKGSNSRLASYPKFDASDPPTGDSWDDAAGLDVCGNKSGPGGNINYWGLISQGYLNSDGTPKRGIAYSFDTCSQTPYVYDPVKEVMVSFDNPKSFAAKGKFIKNEGLAGFAMWEAGGDFENKLISSIRASGGF